MGRGDGATGEVGKEEAHYKPEGVTSALDHRFSSFVIAKTY